MGWRSAMLGVARWYSRRRGEGREGVSLFSLVYVGGAWGIGPFEAVVSSILDLDWEIG